MSKTKDILKAAAISGVAVPLMGVVAHVLEDGPFLESDANLADRFECAYSFNPKNKTFSSWQYVPSESEECWTDGHGTIINGEKCPIPDAWVERDAAHPFDVKLCARGEYTANPFLTGAMYLAIGGIAYARIRRKKRPVVYPNIKTR